VPALVFREFVPSLMSSANAKEEVKNKIQAETIILFTASSV
jgi:hypothetical protein